MHDVVPDLFEMWALLFLLDICCEGSAFAEAESQEPIKLTMHDWTGQLLTTTIMGKVLAEAGYNVEYVQADYIAQFAGLKTGDLHLAMEIWETTGREALDEAVGSGNVVNMGVSAPQSNAVTSANEHSGCCQRAWHAPGSPARDPVPPP